MNPLQNLSRLVMCLSLQGRGKDVLTKVSLNAPPVDIWHLFALLPLRAAASSPFSDVSVFLAFQVQLQKHTRQRLERAGM